MFEHWRKTPLIIATVALLAFIAIHAGIYATGSPAAVSTDGNYHFTWYDNISGANWVLMANPAGSGGNIDFSLTIDGQSAPLPRWCDPGCTPEQEAAYNNGQAPPGKTVVARYPGLMGGPVRVGSTLTSEAIVSQRTLWPAGGNSLEEVVGTETQRLSNHFYWTWYDQASYGYTNWVLVSNPNAGPIYYEVYIAGTLRTGGDINAGEDTANTFPDVIGGPVEVRAWTDSSKTTPAAVMASQRVIWNGFFNEVVGPMDSPVAVVPPLAINPAPPTSPVKLVFVHHSTGENWLADGNGGLGITLRDNNYFVSDTNYGWGPGSIGDTTDIGHWYDWFVGASRDTYMAALFNESSQHSSYSRLGSDPGGANEIVMFKSCFPNSALSGNPGDPPATGTNPLRGQDASSPYMTVANAKGIYNDLLLYFAAHQEKLFVVIAAPPLDSGSTNASEAANARAFNRWLVEDWLDGYAYDNVAVFDFFNVLTSNGGSPNTSDLGVPGGNHHRYLGGAIEYITDQGSNYSAYTVGGDSHPTAAGGQKASSEFVEILNIAYNRWKGI